MSWTAFGLVILAVWVNGSQGVGDSSEKNEKIQQTAEKDIAGFSFVSSWKCVGKPMQPGEKLNESMTATSRLRKIHIRDLGLSIEPLSHLSREILVERQGVWFHDGHGKFLWIRGIRKILWKNIIYIYTHDSQNLYTKGKRGRPVFSRVSSVKFQSKVWFLKLFDCPAPLMPRRFGLCHFNFHRFTWISFNSYSSALMFVWVKKLKLM